jgi:hypothetical protein
VTSQPEAFNPNSPQALRGKRRLRALGIDVDELGHDGVREAYEAYRAAYIDTAEAGRHFEPLRTEGDPLSGACFHSKWGMLTDALKAAFGWSETPDGWSPHRVTWPTPEERRRGMRGR